MPIEKKPKSFYFKIFLFFASALFFSLIMTFALFMTFAFLISGEYELLFAGGFYFVVSIGLFIVTKKLQPFWEEYQLIRGIKQKTTTEFLKEILPNMGFMFFLVVFFGLIDQYFNLIFFPSISKELTKNILETFITFNGILIGFFGVVFAQFISAIHNKGNVLYQQLIINSENSRKLHYLTQELKILKKDRNAAIFSMFCSIVFLIISVLLSYSQITEIDQVKTLLVDSKEVFFYPLLITISAIVLLIMSVFQLDLLPRIKEPTRLLTDY
ncbi:MAG: hypothetical protein IAX21_03635 [Candidatus Bathyarchaeota archaeon]|nr:MAG: hypothetical protein IAX21_03635 [Candidatus Bathyarchaeota archaeon]